MILRRSGWWMTGSGCSILHLAEQHPARISAPPPRWLRVSTAAMSRSAPVASSGESVTDLSILQSESNLWYRVLYVKPKDFRFPSPLSGRSVTGCRTGVARAPAVEPGDAMLPQQVTYGVDGPRGVLTSGFVFGVATH